MATTTTFPFALYDSFTSNALGGSQACVVTDASALPIDMRQSLAREMGCPATCFVDEVQDGTIQAQFFSTVQELPMCGHGTVGMVTRMIDTGVLSWDHEDRLSINLRLRNDGSNVLVFPDDQKRPTIMLQVNPPEFRDVAIDEDRLAKMLGTTTDNFSSRYPIESAVGDFIHLIVPVRDLAAMGRLDPDFQAIAAYCREINVGTLAVFSTEVEDPASTLHVRDFCPAVGVAESAAAGTTNAALCCYLIRHGLVNGNDGVTRVQAEQGLEIGRPSTIRTEAMIKGGTVEALWVGGIATKLAEGNLQLPV